MHEVGALVRSPLLLARVQDFHKLEKTLLCDLKGSKSLVKYRRIDVRTDSERVRIFPEFLSSSHREREIRNSFGTFFSRGG